jgi:crotonobetainyl-CoA:carnitine CoA-transferase CaiB-like acyl-CoA transferase
VFQAMGGLMSLTGEKGGGPVKPGLPVADLTSGLWVAIGILAMLAGREKTGRGACLDFSMLDGQVSLLTLAAARYFALGEVPQRLGTEHPGRVPSATFRCKDGRFAHITASDQHWEPLCRVLKLKFDLDLSTNEMRVRHRDIVMLKLNEEISRIERARLLQMLDEADVPVGPVNDVAEVLADPQVRARAMVGGFDYPGVGEFKALALPYKFLGWDNPEIGAPPALGRDTQRVLAERLGYSIEQIEALRAAKAI